ncbi:MULTISPECIES: multidrug effflux MFS transporter [unclassified Acinetobacter]|uniref:multidrug effflux MFS transporter n=1 Tax=unclassified Acinetobacter TaxID=196816 RepID=UPI0035B8CA36
MSTSQITANNRQPDYPTTWIMILGLMIAIGPLSIDMYLPALPTMAKDFGVPTSWISNSVPAYFAGLVVGQLFYGPLSDRYGRLKPLYFGMTLYIIASIACAMTNNEYTLFLARTTQALGACVGAVVPRAMVRDRLPPLQMAKAFSLMTLVMGLAPILAPSLGALVLQVSDWRTIFWFLAAFGTFNLLLSIFYLKETLADENRITTSMKYVLHDYLALIKDKQFYLPALGSGLLMGAMFVYINTASELIMQQYQVSATHFAWIFGSNAAGFIALTQVNQILLKRFHLISILRFGAAIQAISVLCLLMIGLLFGTGIHLAWILACIFCCIAALGLTQPNAVALVLAFQKKRAGTASALHGSLLFLTGILGGILLHFMHFNIVLKLGLVMAVLMVIGAILVYSIDKNVDFHKA